MGATKRSIETDADKTFEEAAAALQAGITRTENGDSVQSALLTIQLGLKAPKDQVNSFAHFNYRTAGQILEKVKPFLAEVGCTLNVNEDIVLIGDRYYVHSTITLHHIASGEEVTTSAMAREGLTEKGKMDAQMTGSASTFAKKYALCNLFAIDDSSEDPDIVSEKDRVQEAINALNKAISKEDIETAKGLYYDVMQNPSVVEAGRSARQRIGY